MPDFRVSDASGAFREPVGLWVSDAAGQFRVPTKVWVSDTAGEYQLAWDSTGGIITLALANGATSYSQVKATWSAVAGATNYRLYRIGSTTPLYNGGALTYTFAAAPSTAYAVYVEARNAGGTVIATSTDQGRTTTGLPSPTRLRLSSLSSSAAVIDWDSVLGATAYELRNASSGALAYSGAGAGPVTVGAAPRTAYSYQVRSRLGAAASGWSTALSFTAPAAPGPAAGTYSYLATSSATWSPGTADWRPSSEGLYHGNGRQWGSPRGNQSGWFFYGNHPFSALRGGTVTRIQIHLARLDDAGTNAAQANHWLLHDFTGRPSGSPLSGIDTGAYIGSLARGTEDWFDLPVSWGQALVNGASAGIGWGDVDEHYMHAASVASNANNGKLLITIT